MAVDQASVVTGQRTSSRDCRADACERAEMLEGRRGCNRCPVTIQQGRSLGEAEDASDFFFEKGLIEYN